MTLWLLKTMSCLSEQEKSSVCLTAGQKLNANHIIIHNKFNTTFYPSDENWWKGETHLGTGLFPASFVSSDLSVDPEPCELAY